VNGLRELPEVVMSKGSAICGAVTAAGAGIVVVSVGAKRSATEIDVRAAG